jgi:tripartite-type tricarboxylate transporter receptor subunit TctC
MLYRSTAIVRRAVVLAAACASLSGLHAFAQSAAGFPNKAIHIFVANAAGGGTDFLARLIGQTMSERLGQPVVIENKPGAKSEDYARLIDKELVRRAEVAKAGNIRIQ